MSNIISGSNLSPPLALDQPAPQAGITLQEELALLEASRLLLSQSKVNLEEVLQRPALRFNSDRTKEVSPQDYFLSVIHLLNPNLGNTHKARPAHLTKEQRAHVKPQENYKDLKELRKTLFESVQKELANTHFDNLTMQVMSYLKAGYSFDQVLNQILNPKGLATAEQFQEIRSVYNKLLTKEKDAFVSLDSCLGDDNQFKAHVIGHENFPQTSQSSLKVSDDYSLGLFEGEVTADTSTSGSQTSSTPAPLNSEQEKKLIELNELRVLINTKWTPELIKSVLELEDSHNISRTLFLALHPQIPPKPVKTAELLPHISKGQDYIQELKLGSQAEKELALKLEVYWTAERLHKSKLNETIVLFKKQFKNLEMYSSALLEGMNNKRAQIQRDREEFQLALRNDFKDLIEKSAPSIVEDHQIIDQLVTEHKRHTFARFGTIYQHYASFVNCANKIAGLLESKSPGAGAQFKTALVGLVREAHHSEESNAPEKTSDQLYRNKQIMGYEQKDSIPEDQRQIAIMRLNHAMRAHMGTEKTDDFQRSHTLPFPAMFSWKADKMVEHLNRAGLAGLAGHKEIHIDKDFFLQFKEGKINEDQLLKLIQQYMEEQTGTPTELAYYGLDVLKYFYLKVFSETEFLPDFINQEFDHISEWALKGQNLDYKKELSYKMAELLQRNGKISKEDVVASLDRYLRETLAAAQKSLTSVVDSENLSRLSKLVRMICLIQLRQSVLTNTQSLAAIQSKEEIQNIWKTAVAKMAIPVS